MRCTHAHPSQLADALGSDETLTNATAYLHHEQGMETLREVQGLRVTAGRFPVVSVLKSSFAARYGGHPLEDECSPHCHLLPALGGVASSTQSDAHPPLEDKRVHCACPEKWTEAPFTFSV